MANPKEIIVEESLDDLKKVLKKQPNHLMNRIRMLIEIKKNDIPLSKNALAQKLNVNHNSIQKWRKMYIEGGISNLLSHNKIGYKPSFLNNDERKQLEDLLKNPNNGLTSYIGLQEWINDNLKKDVKYVTVYSYVKRNFETKLKIARKSNINKDEEQVDSFKKNSQK